MGTFSAQSFLFDFLGVVMNAIYLWLPAITIFFRLEILAVLHKIA